MCVRDRTQCKIGARVELRKSLGCRVLRSTPLPAGWLDTSPWRRNQRGDTDLWDPSRRTVRVGIASPARILL